MNTFPLFFKLEDRNVLIVGGGDVAARVVERRVGLQGFGHRDVNTAVLGIPGAGQDNHAEHVAGTTAGDFNRVFVDVVAVIEK